MYRNKYWCNPACKPACEDGNDYVCSIFDEIVANPYGIPITMAQHIYENDCNEKSTYSDTFSIHEKLKNEKDVITSTFNRIHANILKFFDWNPEPVTDEIGKTTQPPAPATIDNAINALYLMIENDITLLNKYELQYLTLLNTLCTKTNAECTDCLCVDCHTDNLYIGFYNTLMMQIQNIVSDVQYINTNNTDLLPGTSTQNSVPGILKRLLGFLGTLLDNVIEIVNNTVNQYLEFLSTVCGCNVVCKSVTPSNCHVNTCRSVCPPKKCTPCTPCTPVKKCNTCFVPQESICKIRKLIHILGRTSDQVIQWDDQVTTALAAIAQSVEFYQFAEIHSNIVINIQSAGDAIDTIIKMQCV
jgi:hypothetical protein